MAPTERQTIDGLLSMLRDAGAIQEVREARLITDGLQNLVLVIDEELVARIPRDADGRRALTEEHQLVAHLRNHVSSPLPQLVASTEELAVYRMLQGEPITRGALARLDRLHCERLVDDVAEFLAEMHSAPIAEGSTSEHRYKVTVSLARAARSSQRRPEAAAVAAPTGLA